MHYFEGSETVAPVGRMSNPSHNRQREFRVGDQRVRACVFIFSIARARGREIGATGKDAAAVEERGQCEQRSPWGGKRVGSAQNRWLAMRRRACEVPAAPRW